MVHTSSRRLGNQIAEIQQSIETAAMTPTKADLGRYLQIWRQVASGEDTWVLLNDGGGKFGSIDEGATPAQFSGKILLVRYHISDAMGRHVYLADILIPDRPVTDLKMPEAGSIAGHTASLSISTRGDRARIALTVGEHEPMPVGIVGQTSIGTASQQIGSFRLDGQDLRVFVTTQRLSELRT